jgi:ABC-type nitrate/sulfonate/bicarbonate transport system substrate-binding protein
MPEMQETPVVSELEGANNSSADRGKMKKKLGWKVLIVLTLLLIVGSLFLIYKVLYSQSEVPLKKITVRLAWLHNGQFAGFYLAKEKGYYKEAGLDVTFKQYEDGLDIGHEVGLEKVNFAVLTPVELISAYSNGTSIRAVAAIYQDSPFAFASLQSKNIIHPLHFKGKILGMKGGNAQAKVTYNALINSFHVHEHDVTLKSLDFSVDEVEDLLRNRADVIDLYRTDQSYTLVKKGVAFNLLKPEQFYFGTYGDLIVTTTNFIEQQPDVVHAFVKASLKGWSYALTNKDEAVKVTINYADSPQYKDTAREAYIINQSSLLIQPTKGSKIGAMQYIPFARTYESMKDAGLVKKSFDVSEIFTTEFIN